MKQTVIILTSESSFSIAETIQKEITGAKIYCKAGIAGTIRIDSIRNCVAELFNQTGAFIFIGAMGICVRSIASHIRDKYSDPAVINIDSTGQFVIPVLSGHVGGANELSRQMAHLIGGQAVITTQSDTNHLWALDILGKKQDWATATDTSDLNIPITLFVNKNPTALLLDVRVEGTAYLERSKPEHVDVYYDYASIDFRRYKLLIAVSPFLYPDCPVSTLYYHPKVLHLGVGCRKDCNPAGVAESIRLQLRQQNIAIASLKDISTIDIKKDEALISSLQQAFGQLPVRIYTAEELKDIEVPNPSEKVQEVTGVAGVAESTAIRSADGGPLIIEKQKGGLNKSDQFTFAVALHRTALRRGHIEIVGAGPGDPDLVSVKGRRFLEVADLILYAGSLVPIELTHCAKEEAVVRSSASMDLEEQFALMKTFYDQGKLIVRLHTGDPCIYGAIQEQMAYFDEHGMSYHITPGISSFQAAAAALRSQFTIPEKVQTIILTRGEGRTLMPEKEKLHLLARSQSTMCIFLSATLSDEVQKELLVHYPPDTPVAVCYKLTWKDERIFRGQLSDLSKIINDNNLTLTTLIVVGESIDNRRGLSRLYSHPFKHLFRK